ncbi:MAG TPA: hypothetical protein VFU31_07875 [Candidatus Binatia bacterium]|nr:hypothetical protein [Candidatus Binatia bacterium]
MIVIDGRDLPNAEDESGDFVEIEDTLDDAERRRFIALDHAVRISGGANDAKSIVESAGVFEAYLKNGE